MDLDLADLQRRLNDAIQELQLAIRRYETEGRLDGVFIVKNYLRRFQDGEPERAETAVKIAKETEEEIDEFRIKESDLLSRAAMARLQGDQIALAATVNGIGDIFAEFSSTLDDATARLLRLNNLLAPPRPDLQAQLDRRRMETAKVGESVISVVKLAAAVYTFRCDTLKDFRNNNLEVGREELIRRLRGMLVSIPAEEAFDRFRKLVQELLAEQLKKLPLIGWLIWIADKVKKLSKPKAGTTYGDTDIMLKLLPSLRKDQEMINELDRVFQELMTKH